MSRPIDAPAGMQALIGFRLTKPGAAPSARKRPLSSAERLRARIRFRELTERTARKGIIRRIGMSESSRSLVDAQAVLTQFPIEVPLADSEHFRGVSAVAIAALQGKLDLF